MPPSEPVVHQSRPPGRLRFVLAYWTTIRVLASYLWVRFWGPMLGPRYVAAALSKRHLVNARRIERMILRLQGLFIKVGQLISIMTNFLPPEFRQQLEGVQDAVPPVEYERIRLRFREEFGNDPEQMFASFERRPIASASMSQVHKATLETGECVAVKVQYPEVERLVHSDLKTFRRIIQLISLFFPYQGLDTVFSEISQMLLSELDFAEEARSLEAIQDNFEGVAFVTFPKVYQEYSTRRILTTEFLSGTKVSNVDELDERNVARSKVAQMVIDMYCKQIFVDGLYHADPHPGNIFVTDGPRIALVDFGAVARVSPRMRQGIIEFLQGIINQNTEKIIRAMKEMGFVSRQGADDDRVFEKVVDYFHHQFRESIQLENFNLRDIKIDPEEGLRHLVELRKLDVGLRELAGAFHVPKEWILLERTLLLLTGLCTLLDDQLQPMDYIRPYVEEFVLGQDRDWSGFVLKTTKEIGLEYLSIPAEFKKFLHRASQGSLSFSIKESKQNSQRLYALGHQMIWALFTVTSAVLATVFHINQMPELAEMSRCGAYGFGGIMALSMFSWWRRNKS